MGRIVPQVGVLIMNKDKKNRTENQFDFFLYFYKHFQPGDSNNFFKLKTALHTENKPIMNNELLQPSIVEIQQTIGCHKGT